jgi:hypothetical protein
MVAGLRPESLPSRRAFETSPLDYLLCRLHGSLHVGIALSKPLAYLWNVLRMLDFIVALAAGFLSSPVNCSGSPSIIRTSSVLHTRVIYRRTPRLCSLASRLLDQRRQMYQESRLRMSR